MPSSKVDVLIIGAGPAGLLLATQLAKLKVDCRIIDKQAHPVLRGHADGLQCRTGEVFEALGVKPQFDAESHECAEVVIWDPHPETGEIIETSRVVDTTPGLSRIRHVLLGQNRVEAIFIQAMKRYNNLEVQRLLEPTSLQVSNERINDPSSYPVTVTLKKLSPPKEFDETSGLYRSNLFVDESSTAANNINGDHTDEETIQCKYLIGCDGARSWVRKSLNLHLEGDSSNVYWGAFDAILKTNVGSGCYFELHELLLRAAQADQVLQLPTTRMKHSIHSRDHGTVMFVPREQGMVRIYTEMGSLQPGERVNRADVTLDKLMEKTKLVLKPYEVDFCYVDWHTCYEIGQRVCDTFAMHNNRILLAGDAVHTHSPKAGQGMNVSMMDTWNMGWKLNAVLQGIAKPELLATYQTERHGTAKALIDFDRYWASLMSSAKSKSVNAETVSPEAMKKAWEQSVAFTSGTGVIYEPNMLTDKTTSKAKGLASNIVIGKHFESRQVVGAFNAHSIALQSRLKGDARFRIIIFPGDIRKQDRLDRLRILGEQLGSSNGPTNLYTKQGHEIDGFVEILTVFATPHRDVQHLAQSLPESLVPRRPPFGLLAEDTLFCDEDSYHTGHGLAYEGYGIDLTVGCAGVVRPDHHVGGVYALDDFDGIAAYFARAFIPQKSA